MPPDHHNSHPRSRGDSEPRPCFLFIATCRGGPLVPAAAHNGCFQGQLICAETTWPKETRKKRPNSVFLGLKHLAHCPKSRYRTPFCAPSRRVYYLNGEVMGRVSTEIFAYYFGSSAHNYIWTFYLLLECLLMLPDLASVFTSSADDTLLPLSLPKALGGNL